MAKVIGTGETVTDIIIRNGRPEDMVCGGSCFNSMISLGRSGVESVFIGEVGDDKLGQQTLAFLGKNGIATEYMQMTRGKKSQLSLAFLNERNDAEYVFYKDHASDTFPQRLPEVERGDVVLYGSFFALNPIVHPQLSAFVGHAAEQGAIVYYDINFRASHLSERDTLTAQLEDNFSKATIVRGSDEDFRHIFSTDDANEVYQRVSPLCSVLIITRGGDSVTVMTPSWSKDYAVAPTRVVSTVGAGDNFNAGVVYALISRGIMRDQLLTLPTAEWDAIINTGICYAAEVCGTTENYIKKK